MALHFNSKLCRGKNVTANWNLNLKNLCDKDFHTFCSQACCTIPVESEDGPEATFLLYFDETTEKYAHLSPSNAKVTLYKEDIWLRLLIRASSISTEKSHNMRCEIRVDFEKGSDDVINSVDHVKRVLSLKEMTYGVVLKERCVKLGNKIVRAVTNHGHQPLDVYYPNVGRFVAAPRGNNLPLKVTLRLIHTTNVMMTTAEDKILQSEKTQEISLLKDLKSIFNEKENYPDIKLEMDGNVTLSAHTFVVCARSPMLRDLIKNKIKMGGFNRKLRLDGINGKSMDIILNWMYTGELDETLVGDSDGVAEGVLKAAVKLQVLGMIKDLNRKLVDYCTTQNMFQLYKVSKENGLGNAALGIGKFIQENL